jgi:hypothetical protein
MADDSRYPPPVKLEPLLTAIQQVTKALADAKAPLLRDAVMKLSRLAEDQYFPLCMRAHVFKDPDDRDEKKR